MDLARPLQVGSLINQRYLVNGHIGAGGYGQVLAATDTTTHTPVAVKILHENATKHDPDAASRLRQEAQILRAIDHPNIVRVLEVGAFDDIPFLVMEYIDGIGLDELLQKENTLTTERLLPLLRQLLAALKAAHHRSVLHRDLKPENILITSVLGQETIKLVDFGIAKATSLLNDTDPDEAITLLQTRAGGFVGTPRYAAPEMVVGDPVGPTADLFCLGLVVYEALTGLSLTAGASYQEVINKLITPTAFSLDPLDPLWQKWLAPLVEKSPERRVQSAQEALKSLALIFPPDHLEPLAVLDSAAVTTTWDRLDSDTEEYAPLNEINRFKNVDIDYAILQEARQLARQAPPQTTDPQPQIPTPAPPEILEQSSAPRLDTILTFLLVALLGLLLMGALLIWLPN